MCHAICTYENSSHEGFAVAVHSYLAYTHNYLSCAHGMFAEALQEKQNEMEYVTKQKAQVEFTKL